MNINIEDITVKYEKCIVRITTDNALMQLLRGHAFRQGFKLSQYILSKHYDIYNSTLMISTKSLATEIIIHAYMDKYMGFIPFIKKHTEIIDSGEKKVDGNRVIFDILSHIVYPFRKDN